MGQALDRSHNAAWDAICRSQAVIEFDPGGTILWANDVFLATMGYELEDVCGRHHRMFCDDEYAQSSHYANFWIKLARGEFDAGEYGRLTSDGRTVWLQATYNPVFGPDGEVQRILKIATDISLSHHLKGVLKDKVDGLIDIVDRIGSLPGRPIYSRSMLPLKRHGQDMQGGGLLSWLPR